MRLLVAVASMIAVLLAAPAVAQQFKSIGEKEKQEQPKKKSEEDRGYKSAIDRLPDQKFDPWRNIR